MRKILLIGGGIVVILVLACGLTVANLREQRSQRYSLTDFGLISPLTTDCASIRGKENYPVTLSLTTKNVAGMRDEIKTLIAKYNGKVNSDSYNSYLVASSPQASVSQDSTMLVVSFTQSQKEFFDDLKNVVKNFGAENAGYNFQSGSLEGAYSPYSTCVGMLYSISLDEKQMEIFTQALRYEKNPETVSLISQSIANVRTTLQSNISNLDSFFLTTNNPTVTISINSSAAL